MVYRKTFGYLLKEKQRIATQLKRCRRELFYQTAERKKREEELVFALAKIEFQNKEKDNHATELEVADKELRFQNDGKDKRAAELAFANNELEQMTRIASHDLQEPIRIIQGYMEVIEEDYAAQLDDGAFRYIRSVKAAAERMSLLVKALMNFSRLGHYKHLSFVCVKDLVEDVITGLQPIITDAHATIEVGEMPNLNLYKDEFSQMVHHLIINALKFKKTGVDPHIEIHSEKENGLWRFIVSDNGIGIARDHFDKIFDIFQRLHINNQYEGTGIGLANCKKIVEFHGGAIWIESEEGEGATINFTISELHI